MNGSTDKFDDWVRECYRRRVHQADADGVKRTEAIDDVVRIITADIQRGDLELPVDIRLLVQRLIETDDRKRRKDQVETVQLVVDVVNQLTILGDADPVLNEVAVIGDGLRKSWRYVNIDDLLEMAQTKTTKAMEATIAANAFLTNVRAITSHMIREFGPGGMIGSYAT